MRYLIDGHNLIAFLPDIDLADPDDEAKLVYKLRGFNARTGKRVTVVFDGGIPGGISETLSTSKVTAKFASAQRLSADDVLLKMIREIKNPREYTLVSSDREIRQIAAECGMPTLTADEFARKLANGTSPEKAAAPQTDEEKDEQVRLSAREVEEWLNIFNQPPNNNKRYR